MPKLDEILTLTNVARIQYVQFFGLATMLTNDFGKKLFYEKLLNHPEGKDEFKNYFNIAYLITFVSIGAFFAAVAQYRSSAAQRKVMQYMSGAYLLPLLVLYLHNQENMHVATAFFFLNFSLILANVYGIHREDKLERQVNTNIWFKVAIRITYGSYLLAFAIDFPNVAATLPIQGNFFKSASSYRSNLFHVRMIAVLNLLIAMGQIGAAQLPDLDMKKTVQYLMVRCIVVVPFGLLVADVCTHQLRTRLIFVQLLLAFYVHACYPAPIEKSFLRALYIGCFTRAYHCFFHSAHYLETEMPYLQALTGGVPGGGAAAPPSAAGPGAAAASKPVSADTFTDPFMKIIGLTIMMRAFLYVGAARIDVHSQRIFLRYLLIALVLCLAGLYHVFGTCDTVTFVVSSLIFLVLYHEKVGLGKVMGPLMGSGEDDYYRESPRSSKLGSSKPKSASRRSTTPKKAR